MNKILLIIGVVIAIVAVGALAQSKFFGEPKQVACTQEAKLCPDGSYVGRTGPNCEFAACPMASTVPKAKSGITGTVLLGPMCPVERMPPDPQCAEKPFQTTLAVTTPDGARVIAELTSDTQGKFKVSVAPGEYAIRSAAAANVLPYCSSDVVKVSAGKFTDAVVRCDSGIR